MARGQKRKRQEAERGRVFEQDSPFAPTGKFRAEGVTLDCHYKVEPEDKWLKMTKYNSFVLKKNKYFCESFIYVDNESSDSNDWVARILEIRAFDQHHVYARIYWMYNPDDIPVGTKDPNSQDVCGRQPYHGQLELVASNHMDIIHVVSVTGEAKVQQWIEDDEPQDSHYWRQALQLPNLQLSSPIHRICKCQEPNNPDKVIVACSNTGCGVWLHEECLRQDALVRTFDELGRDNPHHTPALAVRTKTDKEPGRALSPPDDSVNTQQTFDARLGNSIDGAAALKTSEALLVAQGKPSLNTSITIASVACKKKRKRKGVQTEPQPWEGLYDAELNAAKNRIEIKDLRQNIKDGDKEWHVPLRCLVCNVLTV